MRDSRWSRRALLQAGCVGGVVASSGCLGLGGGAPSCSDDGVALVFRSQLRGWYVSYPATTGLFDVDGEDRDGPAKRLARLAREAGYTVEYYFAEDYGRGTDDEWQVELHGELDRATVERLVRAADMPEATEISERTGTLSRGSELKWPWSPGLLDGRATFLAEHAPRVGVSLPTFGPTSGEAVALTDVPDEETLEWLRSVLAGRGVLRVAIQNVPEDDNPLTDEVVSNYHVSRDGDSYFSTDDVRVRGDGTVETGLYVEPLLKTVYRPRREDDLPYLEQARLQVSLDGRIVSTRPLNDAERSYLRAYRDFIAADDTMDREAPEPPDLRLTAVEERTALRAATLLAYPEDARFGVAVERCAGAEDD